MAISANVRYLCGRVPAVLSTHGGFWHTNRGYVLKRIYEKTLLRGAVGQYQRVLASSVGDYAYFNQYAGRISLCGNGVHVREFNRVVRQVAQNPFRWIYWGRLSRNKRIDLVIDYAADVIERGFPIELLICGRDFDGLLPELEAQVRRLEIGGHVHFESFLSDDRLREELGDRSVYITASEHEGFGLSVVEAMAAGLIVVCRDMVPLNSFFEHGASGWLLNFDRSPQDFGRLTELMSTAPERLRRMSAAATAAASVHDWDVAVPRFVGHYRDAIASRR